MEGVTLATVREEGGERYYPVDRLEGLRTALMGFCAAFLGKQDCVWVADAGIAATGVDLDASRVGDMVDLYPKTWDFHVADVFDFAARRYAEGVRYDLVSLDPPTSMFGEVAEAVDLWCGIANELVVLGSSPGLLGRVPDGWVQVDRVFRSGKYGGVYWAVLEKEAPFDVSA